jgi:hypothetical protein
MYPHHILPIYYPYNNYNHLHHGEQQHINKIHHHQQQQQQTLQHGTPKDQEDRPLRRHLTHHHAHP